MPQESYEDFRNRMFGSAYMIWHDGPDVASLRLLRGEDREHAYAMLMQGLAEGDYVAVEGLGELDPVRALPDIRRAYATGQSKMMRIAMAEFLRKHDPQANREELAVHIVNTLAQNDSDSLTALIVLRYYPCNAYVRDALVTYVEKHRDYLVRYHAADTLLYLAGQLSIDRQPEILTLIKGVANDAPTDADHVRYAEAAARLRAMFPIDAKTSQ